VKPRNREVNIFNMSLLDILCGALGAFCFLTIAVMPYYGKTAGGQEGQKTQQELTEARKEVEKLKAELARSGQKTSAGQEAASPFLVVTVEWGAPQSEFKIVLEHPDPKVQTMLKVTKLYDRQVLLLPDVPGGEYQMYFVPDMKVISANETLQSMMCDKVSCISLPPINVKAFQPTDRIPAGTITIRPDGQAAYKKP